MRKRCLARGCNIMIGQGSSYCSAHQRARDRRYSDPIYKENRLAVLAAAAGRCDCPGCGMCNGDCPNYADTVDHVVSLDKGGTSAIGNLRSCCRSCNSSKRSS
jgi:5-methylcytosine-specific restriction endonuclease McrA